MTRRVAAVIAKGGFQQDQSLDRKRTALLVGHVSFGAQSQCHVGAKPTSRSATGQASGAAAQRYWPFNRTVRAVRSRDAAERCAETGMGAEPPSDSACE
jgi:hypothetical protein